MNKYLINKLINANVNEENLLGFYWDGLHEDEGLVRCSLSDMPRILSHDYILLKCPICKSEFYKRLIDLENPNCHYCNQLDHWNSMRVDWISEIKLNLNQYNLSLVGYLENGLDSKLINIEDPNLLPQLGCSDYVRLKCNKCGHIFNRRLNHIKEKLDCPLCSWRSSNYNQRIDWISRIKDYILEFDLSFIGYYDKDELIKCDINTLHRSFTKHNIMYYKCNKCGREFYRGLYHLDYGCNHDKHRLIKFESGILETKFGLLDYYSSYEKKFIELACNIKEINSIIAQPCDHVIPYKLSDGSTHNYYPDFYIEYSGNKFIVEIKPSTIIDTEKIQAKITASLLYFKDIDITYIVITEEELLSDNPIEELKYRFTLENKINQLKERNLI